jgi:hypothetical protein
MGGGGEGGRRKRRRFPDARGSPPDLPRRGVGGGAPLGRVHVGSMYQN